MFTQDEIINIASLPESALRFKCHVDALMTLYKWVREQWTTKAIAEHRAKYDLDCRSTEGKLKFALFAARELSQDCLPSVVAQPNEPVEPVESNATDETNSTNESAVAQTNRILCQAIALLPPVPKTNGLEKSPPYQVMGEPVYIDELVRNYKQLVIRWHPDYNKSVEAVGRFQLITQIYQELRDNWFVKYSPLIPLEKIGIENVQRAMLKQFPWTPQSFWT